jgi:hypothetical protein
MAHYGSEFHNHKLALDKEYSRNDYALGFADIAGEDNYYTLDLYKLHYGILIDQVEYHTDDRHQFDDKYGH